MAKGKHSGLVYTVPAMAEGRIPKVVILGAGFAGLTAAKALEGLALEVTVVDRQNHHTFQPLLYQVALAVLAPNDIAIPIRATMQCGTNVEVLMGEVVAVDTVTKSVTLGDGATLPYDYLIVATGSTTSYFGHAEWAQFAPGLKTIEDSVEIRRRVLLAFELAERQAAETGSHAPLDFVVIGGGPTGVELAGAIAEIARVFLKHDFIHLYPRKSRVILLEGGPRILQAYPEDLSRNGEKQLKELGVDVRTGTRVEDLGPGFVKIKGGERIDAAVMVWAAGVGASEVGAMLNVDMDRRKRVRVNKLLNPAGHPEIFVCGDLAVVEQDGHEIPGVAQPAIQMGKHAALMIQQDLRGEDRHEFRYFDKGDMATIGRYRAIADVKWPFRGHFSGLPAWMMWLVVHLAFLLGFRNRLVVLMQWGWTYLFFLRSSRLIVGSKELPGWPPRDLKRDILRPDRLAQSEDELYLADKR